MPALLYVLFALPAGGWSGAVDLVASAQLDRCEAIQHQLELAPAHGNTYRCETLVLPAGSRF